MEVVDVVSAVSLQTSVLRQGARGPASSAPVVEKPGVRFVTSHIRVDNLQDVAILEYRSSHTGEVVRQFPSQAQIEAFKNAERIRTQTIQQYHQVSEAPAAPAEGMPQVAASDDGDAAVVVTVAAPAAPVADSGGDAAPAPSSHATSVLA